MLNVELYMNKCCFASTMYMNDYASQYILCFKNFIPAFYVCSCSWGYYAHMSGDSSVLFAGLRVRDVTVWYQSSGCIMGHEYAVTELMLQHLGLRGP